MSLDAILARIDTDLDASLDRRLDLGIDRRGFAEFLLHGIKTADLGFFDVEKNPPFLRGLLTVHSRPADTVQNQGIDFTGRKDFATHLENNLCGKIQSGSSEIYGVSDGGP